MNFIARELVGRGREERIRDAESKALDLQLSKQVRLREDWFRSDRFVSNGETTVSAVGEEHSGTVVVRWERTDLGTGDVQVFRDFRRAMGSGRKRQ